MAVGWIKIHRKLMEDTLYFAEPFTRMQAWIDLLLMANYEATYMFIRGNRVEIKRGQIAKSQDSLADRWRWSRGKVLRFLSELENEHKIVQQKSKLINLISVVNYEKYQEDGTTDGTTNNTSDNTTESTSDGTTDRATLYKKVKNIKNNNIKDIKTESGSNDQLPSASEEAKAPVQKKETIPAKEIKELWNNSCPSYPKLFTISEARKNKMRNRIAEMGGIEKALPLMKQIFAKMEESSFLKGDNRRGWKASFDWLFENDKNWVKVWEGNYENRETKQQTNVINKQCNEEWT